MHYIQMIAAAVCQFDLYVNCSSRSRLIRPRMRMPVSARER
jgi:hypothetical protein